LFDSANPAYLDVHPASKISHRRCNRGPANKKIRDVVPRFGFRMGVSQRRIDREADGNQL
jgi:hypothetical protein